MLEIEVEKKTLMPTRTLFAECDITVMENSYFMFDIEYLTYPNVVMLLKDVITVFDGVNDPSYLESLHPGMISFD
jgi:hypothetical protein